MSDPAISASNPFSGLGASFQITLQAGTYAVAVQSHGSYGDLGQYTLGISQPSIFYYDPGYTLTTYALATTTPTKTTTTSPTSTTTSKTLSTSGAGSSTGVTKQVTLANTVAPITMEQERQLLKTSKLRALDDLFAKWE